MSAISPSSASSTASTIQDFGAPLIAKAVQRIEAYDQITSDAIAQSNARNIKESTDQPLVDAFGQVGLTKGLQIDINI